MNYSFNYQTIRSKMPSLHYTARCTRGLERRTSPDLSAVASAGTLRIFTRESQLLCEWIFVAVGFIRSTTCCPQAPVALISYPLESPGAPTHGAEEHVPPARGYSTAETVVDHVEHLYGLTLQAWHHLCSIEQHADHLIGKIWQRSVQHWGSAQNAI